MQRTFYMTDVVGILEEIEDSREANPIQVIGYLNHQTKTLLEQEVDLSKFDRIVLLTAADETANEVYDTIWASNDQDAFVLYGFWNDGVVAG